MKDADIGISIGGDTSGLNRAVDKAANKLQQFGRKVRENEAAMLKMGTAAVAAGGAMVTAIYAKQSQVIDSLAKTADALGVTTQSLQALNHMAELNGVSSEGMAKGLRRMETRLGEAARRGGSSAEALEDLGINLQEIINKSPEQQIQILADSLKGVENQSVKASIATDIFGREGTKMLKVLNSIEKDGIQPTIKELDSLGVSISRVDAAKVEAANDAFFKGKQVVEGMANTLTVALAPYVEKVANLFTDAARESGGFGDEVQAAVDKSIRFFGKFLDVIHGVKVAFNGIKLIAEGVGFALISVAKTIMDAYTKYLYDPIIENTNKLIVQLNKLPGIDIATLDPFSDSAFMQGLENLSDASAARVTRMREEFHNLAMQEMPSEKIEKFLKTVQEESQKAAEAVARVVSPTKNDEAANDESIDPNADKETEALEKLKAKFLTEQEVYKEHKEALKLIGNEFDASKFESEAEWLKVREQLEAEHQQKLSDLVREGNAAREAFDQLSMKNKVKTVAGELENITSGVAQHNKALFRLNQAAGIANAVINAYEGISKTMAAYPYPVNIGMAAAHAAAAFAQVNAIRSASFSGSGGVSPANAATEPTPVANVGGGSGGGAGQPQQLYVSGLAATDIVSGAMVETLVEKIVEHQRNGGEVIYRAA